jgi:hypothetical protein
VVPVHQSILGSLYGDMINVDQDKNTSSHSTDADHTSALPLNVVKISCHEEVISKVAFCLSSLNNGTREVHHGVVCRLYALNV